MNSSNLTFGVELEFLYQTLEDRGSDPDPGNPVRIPKESQIQANVDRDTRPDFSSQQQREIDFVVRPIIRTLQRADYDAFTTPRYKSIPYDEEKWAVVFEDSVRVDLRKRVRGIKYRGLEVITPVLEDNERSVRSATNVFKCVESCHRVLTNEFCALHVHVGCGRSIFSFEHLQKIAILVWAFDPVIKSCIPPHRHNGWFFQNMRVADTCTINKECFESYQGIDVLLKATTSNRVCELLGGAETTTQFDISFKNLYHNEKGNPDQQWLHDTKRTIEFRAHEATFDPDRVDNWINLVVGMVRWAGSVDLQTVATLAYEHCEPNPWEGTSEWNTKYPQWKSRIDLPELLRILHLDDCAKFYASPQAKEHAKERQGVRVMKARYDHRDTEADYLSDDDREFMERCG